MKCKNCDKEIGFAQLSREWYHSASYNTQCDMLGNAVAEPEFSVEFETESEFGSESNSRSDFGSIQISGQDMGQYEGRLAQPAQEGAGDLSTPIISLYSSFYYTPLPVHQKLKAYDCLNTLLKIASQVEARQAEETFNKPLFE